MNTPVRKTKHFSTDKTAFVATDWFTKPIKQGEYGALPGNNITPFITGSVVFSDIWEKIQNANSTVHVAVWSMMPGFRLIRGTAAEGKPDQTIGEALVSAAKRGVSVRVLLWDMSTAFTETTMGELFRYWQDFSEDPLYGKDTQWFIDAQRNKYPNLEVRVEKPAYSIGSHHQKITMIDGKIGYCGGMNYRTADWDTQDCLYDNPLRDPGMGPRHDTCARIEGPLVKELERNFAERWDRTPSHPNYKGKLARKTITSDLAKIDTQSKGLITGQINRTMYQQDDAIRRSYLNAISKAHHYIYIENQYFRDTEIATAIAKRVTKRKGELKTIIVINPDDAPHIAGSSQAWTFKAFDIVKDAYQSFGIEFVPNCLVTSQPAKYAVYKVKKYINELYDKYKQLFPTDGLLKIIYQHLPENEAKTVVNRLQTQVEGSIDKFLDDLVNHMPKTVYSGIDAHTKTMIIDDAFFTLGSANIHMRGMKNDSEINVAIANTNTAIKLRNELWMKHTSKGITHFLTGIDEWHKQSQENEKRYTAKELLVGHVVPLHIFMEKDQILDYIPIMPPMISKIQNEQTGLA